MKALVKLKKAEGQLEIRDVPDPTPPSPTEVKVEMKYLGVCGTDVKIWHDLHSFYRPPLILGNEFSGVVVEVGEQVSNVKVGDEVIALPATLGGILDNQPRRWSSGRRRALQPRRSSSGRSDWHAAHHRAGGIARSRRGRVGRGDRSCSQ